MVEDPFDEVEAELGRIQVRTFLVCLALFVVMNAIAYALIVASALSTMGGGVHDPTKDYIALVLSGLTFAIFPIGAFFISDTFRTRAGLVTFAAWPLTLLLSLLLSLIRNCNVSIGA